jgi:CMP-N-acetylneuraminic acid synthetase
MKKEILGVIPARGGSVSVPLKNIRKLAGKPLITYAIRAALDSKIDRLIVSTDAPVIKNIARRHGAEVPFDRPDYLAEDVPSELVIEHAVKYMEDKKGFYPDLVITIQCTSPLLKGSDINKCIELLIKKDLDSVITVAEVREYPQWMFERDHDILIPFLGEIHGDVGVRQNLPKLYRPTGACYCTRRDVIMKESRIIGKNCGMVEVPWYRSIDIDEPLDFVVLEGMIQYLRWFD